MGFWSAVAAATGNTQIERLCRELGLSIDIRKGNVVGLNFEGDRITPQRTVYIRHKPGSKVMTFTSFCRAEFSEHTLPDDLLPAMMARNCESPIGGWAADLENGIVTLGLIYMGFAAAFDAANFKTICSLMIDEVAFIEGKLHSKGLL